jgi:hypothetical protein
MGSLFMTSVSPTKHLYGGVNSIELLHELCKTVLLYEIVLFCEPSDL